MKNIRRNEALVQELREKIKKEQKEIQKEKEDIANKENQLKELYDGKR